MKKMLMMTVCFALMGCSSSRWSVVYTAPPVPTVQAQAIDGDYYLVMCSDIRACENEIHQVCSLIFWEQARVSHNDEIAMIFSCHPHNGQTIDGQYRSKVFYP